MTRAIVVRAVGGPDALRAEDVEVPAPGPRQVRLRHTAIGVDFIDTYHRSGLYPVELPAILGLEAAAVVEELGPGVTDLAVGDRVAYATCLGAYAQARVAPVDALVRLPEDVPDDVAAGAMLKGMTARFLVRQTFEVRAGHVVLVHAAAGGVGSLVAQWARHLGATVIGTAGSEDKARRAEANGCHHVIRYRTEDVAQRVRAWTGGCDVVYDGVGAATLTASLDSLKPRGMLVSFGNASGPVRGLDLLELSRRGSLYVTRPTLFSYLATRADLLANAADLFAVLRSGAVRVEISRRWPLERAADAHRALEARDTVGSLLLLP
jgi:NADPH2:quinone reductase